MLLQYQYATFKFVIFAVEESYDNATVTTYFQVEHGTSHRYLVYIKFIIQFGIVPLVGLIELT